MCHSQKLVPKVLTQCRKLGLRGKAIVGRNDFMSRWSTFTSGILNGLDWNNVFCAGGAILANLVADNAAYKGSDIDLFLYGLDSDEAANAKLREIHALVVRNTGGRGDVIRTARAVTILNAGPYRHVQVVLRVYKSPAEVLLGFDIDSCTVGFDGKDVYCMERFKRALTKRYNLVNISRRSLTYEQRLYKYSRRGFAVAVPNLDKSRVNPDIFTKSLKELFGLSKLLLYDHLAQKNVDRTRKWGSENYSITYGETSDYNGDLSIPWHENISLKSLMHILKVRDHRQFFGQLNKMKKAEAAGLPVEKKRPEHLFETIFLDSKAADGSNQPKIAWIRNNPAYQDIDGGFTRPLMTGSFQLPPAVQAVWDLESYASHPTNVTLSQDAGYVPSEQPEGPQFGKVPKSSPARAPQLTTQTPQASGFGGTLGSFAAATGASQTSSGFGSIGGGSLSNNNATRGGFLSYQGTGAATVNTSSIDLNSFGGPTSSSFATFDTQPTLATAASSSTTGGVSFSPNKFSVTKKPVAVAAPAFKEEKESKTEKNRPTKAPVVFAGPFGGSSSSSSSSGPTATLSGASVALILEEFLSLREFITDALKNNSTLQHSSGQDEAPPTTKLLLLVTLCFKQGSITAEEKSTLKDLIIDRNEAVFAALEVFEIDEDLSELVDTFKRAVKSASSR